MLIKKTVFGFRPFYGDIDQALEDYGKEFGQRLWDLNLTIQEKVKEQFPGDTEPWTPEQHKKWCQLILKECEKYGQSISFNLDSVSFELDYPFNMESIFVKSAYPIYLEEEKKVKRIRTTEKTESNYTNFIINTFENAGFSKILFRVIELGNDKKQYSFYTLV